MFNPGKSPTASSVPVSTSENPDRLAELDVGDDLGSFTGYLRRAKSSAAGLVAQFFGENGPDADLITSFHLTRFLDAPVHVTVWQVKDRQGRVMRENGAYPKLVEFEGKIRRPAASIHGQVALFFAENGPHADAVNILNQTRYLDALVHVQLRKADPGVTPAAVPTADLDDAANRMTPSELKALKDQQRKASEAQKLLTQAGFYRNQAVWGALGNGFDFQDWIKAQPCCQPGSEPCDGVPIEAHGMSAHDRDRYGCIPLCRAHAQQWSQGVPDLLGQAPLGFFNLKQVALVQRWAKDRLRRALRVPDGFDPTPSLIYSWTVEQRLQSSLPSGFMALL